MDTQDTHIEIAAGLAYCNCCTPRQLLIPRDDIGTPGRWAVCLASGAWYTNRGDGLFVSAPAPQAGELLPAPGPRARADAWAGGDSLPVVVPGVRIDLSKESYAADEGSGVGGQGSGVGGQLSVEC
ncbi:MAG TPA: hypothetical protein VKY74_07395 [Chloroflexia bacterium]|nr:hypothetical protein [Chloroflexia bacterium]